MSNNTTEQPDTDKIMSFIDNRDIQKICDDFRKAEESSRQGIGFNIFTLISDFYYRENYHSDIIKMFLDPKAHHGEGNIFLNAFIDLLNVFFKRNISTSLYEDAEVIREYCKIDILIKSGTEKSKHCIIIENKIYNAPDMTKQLPRYLGMMTEKGYEVDAIVYLPLNKNKKPDMSGWSETDKKEVNKLLCEIPACDLSKNWIEPCIIAATNMHTTSILKQYNSLIKFLSRTNMDNSTMKFYNYMKNKNGEEILKQAKTITEMVLRIPMALAYEFRSELENYIKEKKLEIQVWKSSAIGFWENYDVGIWKFDKVEDKDYQIEIWPLIEIDKIQIHILKYNETPIEENIFKDFPKNKDYKLEDYNGIKHLVKDFRIFEKNEVIKSVKEIIEHLQQINDKK